MAAWNPSIYFVAREELSYIDFLAGQFGIQAECEQQYLQDSCEDVQEWLGEPREDCPLDYQHSVEATESQKNAKKESEQVWHCTRCDVPSAVCGGACVQWSLSMCTPSVRLDVGNLMWEI